MIDLWPSELTAVDQRTPVAILREQASLLGEKTQNIVVAELVKVSGVASWFPRFFPFNYSFLLTCPALSDYRFRLFTMGSDIDVYPVHFHLDSDVSEELIEKTNGKLLVKDNITQASNEEEFIDILKHTFNSKKALRVIRALLTQAKS
jgi:hypothetical protein